ncbi:MAG: hypothetical protein DRQ99_00205, partial [Candidatus Parabeggiatoa sp. nov. 3]
QSVYVPIKPLKGGIIKSKMLPGFQFRISDLYHRPLLEEMITDPVYQQFVLPGYTKEKEARKKAEQRAERFAQILIEQGIDPDQLV